MFRLNSVAFYVILYNLFIYNICRAVSAIGSKEQLKGVLGPWGAFRVKDSKKIVENFEIYIINIFTLIKYNFPRILFLNLIQQEIKNHPSQLTFFIHFKIELYIVNKG